MALSDLLLLIFFILFSSGLGFLFYKFRLLKINYLVSKEPDENVVGDIEKHKLSEFTTRYSTSSKIMPIVGISWGVLAALLTVAIYYSSTQLFTDALFVWVISSIALLSIILVLIASNTVKLPRNIQSTLSSNYAKPLLVILVLGLLNAIFIQKLNLLSLVLFILLLIPLTISVFYAGEYYTIFAIRQYFVSRGWNYIEGESTGKGVKGTVARSMGLIGLVSSILVPILALNTFIGLFNNTTAEGSVIGQSTEGLVPSQIQNVIVLFLLLGPLIAIATQPTGFFELTMNSEIYTTLSNLDWEEFYRRSSKVKEVINVRPYSERVFGGIMALFVYFIFYVTILSLAGFLDTVNFVIDVNISTLSHSLKFVEIPILILVIMKNVQSFSEEREVFDLANLGMKEDRDVISWYFWVIVNIYKENYDLIENDLDQLLADEKTKDNHRVHFFKGFLEAMKNKHENALDYFKQSVVLKSNFADGWLEVGTTYYFLGDLPKAESNLLRSQSLRDDKLVNFNLGRLYDVMGDHTKSLKHYELALKKAADDPKVWANISAIYYKLGNVEEAIKCGEKALELSSEEHIAKVNLSVIYQAQGQFEKSQKLEAELMNNHLDKPIVLQHLAIGKMQQNKYSEALDLFNRLIALDGVNGENLSHIATTYYRLGRINEGIKLVEKYAQIYPNHLRMHFLLGEMYLEVQDYENSAKTFEYIASIDDKYETTLLKLGSSYGRMGNFEQAINVFERAKSVLPDNADVHFNSGLSKSLFGTNDFDADFRKAIELRYQHNYLSNWVQSRNSFGTLDDQFLEEILSSLSRYTSKKNILLGLGYSFTALGNIERAEGYFKQAVEAEKDFESLNALGVHYLNNQIFDKAKTVFGEMVELYPNNQSFNNLAVVNLRLNDVNGALDAFTKAHELDATDILTIKNISSVLAQTKQYGAAVPYYEKILQLTPGDYFVIFDLGKCKALLNDIPKARELFDQAESLAKGNNDPDTVAKINEFKGYLDQG